MKTYYKYSPKNGGESYITEFAPDSYEIRECDIECFEEEIETDQSIAADSYWCIAETINTQECWSVQEHVKWMKELLEDCLEYLSDIPDDSVGGDRIGLELRKRLELCLSGTAPGYLTPIYGK